jgi:poly(beta-D-mannuronate) lyase
MAIKIMCVSRSNFRIFRAAGTLLVGLILADEAGATDFPVSTVAQITNALAGAQPGDTITMTNKVWTDADILFKKSGTAASPITLRAQTSGQVILNGTSRLRISGNWLVVDGLRFQSGYAPNGAEVIAFRDGSLLATNCVLINCAIIDYSSNKTNNNKWVSIYGRSNRVENCYFAGKTNLGTTLVVWPTATSSNYPNYHIIRRNHFGLRPSLDGVNGAETIRVGTSEVSFTSSRTLVEENLFRFCNGEIEIISNKSCDNLYRHNTFDSCEGMLTLRHGNRCTVEGNWFFGRGLPLTGGVRIIGEDHTVFNNYFDRLTGSDARAALSMVNGITNSPLSGYFQVKRARVLFNTFVNCTNNFAIGVPSGTLPPIDCTNANNIVRGLTAPLVDIQTAPSNFLWQGNYFSGATVGTNNAGIVTNNPLMALSSDGLWRPATNSPVLGAAAGSYTFVTNDFDGQPRTGAKDVGCDQASTSPRTGGPLGPMDVGPDWMRITLSGGPSNQTAAVGGNVSFSVTAEGTPPFSYR